MKDVHTPPRFWPAGPYYGWAVVAVAFLVSFVQVAAHNNPLGFFMRPMQEEFGWSRGQIAGAVAIGSLGGGLMAASLGHLLDRRGTRGALVIASLVLGACLLSLAFIHALWQYYLIYGLARAVSVGAMELAVVVAVANWFVARRARAMGLALVGRRLAIGLLPLLASVLIATWGWRAAWLGMGALALGLAVLPVALFVRRRPEDLGLAPDGAKPAKPGAGEGTSTVAEETGWTLREAMATPAFWLLTSAGSLAMMVSGAVNLHQAPHLLDVGIPPAVAGAVVAVFALSGAAGNIMFGFLAERVPIRHAIGLALLGSAIGMVLLMVTHDTATAFVYAVLYGACFGGLFTLLGIVFADYYGRFAAGAIRGVTLPVNLGVNALGPLFAGVMYDVWGSYTEAFFVFTALFCVGAVLAFLASPPRSRRAAPGLRWSSGVRGER